MVFAQPGTEGAIASYDAQYENFINGEWAPPAAGQYFDNVTPVTGEVFTRVARSQAEDIDLALDAAHAAADAWGRTSTTARARILEQIADRLEANLE
jgi:aldehyde dehydrogenase